LRGKGLACALGALIFLRKDWAALVGLCSLTDLLLFVPLAGAAFLFSKIIFLICIGDSLAVFFGKSTAKIEKKAMIIP